MPLILDGTTGIVANNIADYAISTAKLANNAVTVAKMGHAGAVLQVVRYEITGSVGFSSSSFVTAYTTSITPLLSNSKLLHMFWAKTDMNNTSSQTAQDYQVTRNGSAVWGASWQNYFNRASVATDIYPPCDFVHWDEPATTSTVTYAFQGRIYAGSNGGWTIGNTNQNTPMGPRGNWIIMEIAG